MILEDLGSLAKTSKEKYQEYQKEEVILTNEFKELFTQSTNYKEISFQTYTTVIETDNGLTITFPNQWFYIASYFTEFLTELSKYKHYYDIIFKSLQEDPKTLIKEIKTTKEVPDHIKLTISTTISDENSALLFEKFLSNYAWWHGSKTIDRADYFASPILKLAEVINVSQSYIADLALLLSINPALLEELKKSELKPVKKSSSDEVHTKFSMQGLITDINNAGLFYQPTLITRFISSLITKPFVILSGLSGSGKTKLAQAFAQWICKSPEQYSIIPVGADWTNRDSLLGYSNALNTEEYIKPENGALDLIINANENSHLPYFLILDEMNLSHVERYFADFLSAMESKEEISLFTTNEAKDGVPPKLTLPSNLFIIGTVNIDETTYMFSPKVLDRANAIEFRITQEEIENFLVNQQTIDLNKLEAQGANTAQDFLNLARNKTFTKKDLATTQTVLVNFFAQLKKAGAEFGYRSATEIIRLINQLSIIDTSLSMEEKLDIAIIQKLLPKLHGSRRKLCPILITLGSFCIDKTKVDDIEKDFFLANDVDFNAEEVLYPISLEKITRMYKGAVENGFASYAEA